ncbi:hypothetical protein [Pseudomonas sp. PLMAX]|uniref:hypothetical protein n=1 Tax=Pseudomonas sp. PLMAX TaxID=2201998 RepID=UPI0038BAAB45
MNQFMRPAGFLESIGIGECGAFVDQEIYDLVDRLPLPDNAYSDEDGLLWVLDGLNPNHNDDEKVRACTARFLIEVSREIMGRRPATALYMIESVYTHAPTGVIEKTTTAAVKAFQESGVDGFYRVGAVMTYLGRALSRYTDLPWPADKPELFYLIALAHEAVEALRLDDGRQHQELSRAFDKVMRDVRAAQPNLVNHFRPLAEDPQLALAAGKCTPDEAARRRALGNRFFGVVMERGTNVDLLGNNTRCLKNILQLIADAPARPDYIQSLSSEYDKHEFRETLALKLLSVIHHRSYLRIDIGTETGEHLTSFSTLAGDAKAVFQAFNSGDVSTDLRAKGFNHLLAAVLRGCVNKDVPESDLDQLIDDLSAKAPLEVAYEGSGQAVRTMITDYVIRNCPEQASFLTYQDRGQKFISELGV